jgi:hypothetical protein
MIMLFFQTAQSCAKEKSIINSFPGDVMSPWEGGPAYYSKWSNGPSSSPNFFPIAVWLQNPADPTSGTYKNLGINTYIGLYKGPTENQLTAISSIPMVTICDQNIIGLNSVNKNLIKAWLQADEPDNAVPGTSVPTPISTILARYNEMKSNDNTRPVFLGMGQGVAADLWYGRGDRTNHPEDYVEYSKGGDILSFDIYPMNVYDAPAGSASWKLSYHNLVKQSPWLVAKGVDRLREWSNYSKSVWTCIECTNYKGNAAYALTPEIVKAEVWMALIHGARGLIYFVHTITPFVEAGLLTDTQMMAGISAINTQITSLATVLNTQSVKNGVTVNSENQAVSVDAMIKRMDGYTYLFAVAMRSGSTTVSFMLRDFTGNQTIEVLGEDRSIKSINGGFKDTFSGYGVHIYKVKNEKSSF